MENIPGMGVYFVLYVFVIMYVYCILYCICIFLALAAHERNGVVPPACALCKTFIDLEEEAELLRLKGFDTSILLYRPGEPVCRPRRAHLRRRRRRQAASSVQGRHALPGAAAIAAMDMDRRERVAAAVLAAWRQAQSQSPGQDRPQPQPSSSTSL
jgi:hypothetical protein